MFKPMWSMCVSLQRGRGGWGGGWVSRGSVSTSSTSQREMTSGLPHSMVEEMLYSPLAIHHFIHQSLARAPPPNPLLHLLSLSLSLSLSLCVFIPLLHLLNCPLPPSFVSLPSSGKALYKHARDSASFYPSKLSLSF